MLEFRADLHCHSTCSDGTLTPEEIIQLACDLGLGALSITDHDTLTAYREALPAAQARDLPLISGIELSAVHLQTSIHVLAYSFSLSSPKMHHFCQRHHERREVRNRAMLHLLASNGMPLSAEELEQEAAPSRSVGRPHIALAMVKKGYVPSIQQAFHHYIGEGKPCYAPGLLFSIEETLEVIHAAKGLAILAHPHLIQKTSVLKDLLQMNFDGIEGYYARFPLSRNKRWLKIAAHKHWLITGGSDFHGKMKPQLPLGSSWVNEETFNILQQHFQRNQ